ncbi:MAG: FAD:protein FMN transferase [Chloroflexi bacterium]|nr:FAD:protein FMN transferase [Chloroflexota bacterium]
MEYEEFRAMNTAIVLAAEGDPPALARGFAAAREHIAASEARFTRFSPESELSQLNRSAGGWFMASDELFALLWQARALNEATEGLFNPAVLEVLELAGYDRSLDTVLAPFDRLRPGRGRPGGPPPVGDFRAVEFDQARRAVRLPPGMRLDLGGIAKGWIAEQTARRLAAYSEACAVSAGGDLYAVGVPRRDGDAGGAWQIALADPRDDEQTLAVVRTGPGAVATSSQMKRRWRQDGHERHHLIDPRTGLPAQSEWLSVTAIAPEAAAAEVFAKALLIAGPAEAERIAGRCEGLAFIAVDREGLLWGSANAKGYLDHGIGTI